MISGALALVVALATPSPDPATLFAQERTAAGGAAWDSIAQIVERGTFSGQGLNGKYVTYTDVRNGWVRNEADLAGTTQGHGVDAQGPWDDENGMVDALGDAAAVRSAKTQTYVARNGWWHPLADPATMEYVKREACGDSTCDVVRVVPAGGDPISVWIDTSSHLIVKTASTDSSNVTTTTTFDDYRSTKSIMYPMLSTQSNGDARYDTRTNVASVELDPAVDVAQVRRPANQRSGRIAGGTSTTIPLVLDDPEKGHIIVTGTVNGSRPLHLIFDTGGSNVVTPEVASEIGLHGTGSISGGGAGESHVSIALASGATLRLGAATLTGQQFAIIPLPVSLVHSTSKFSIDGIIGYEVLKNFVVSVDYVHRTLTLTQHAAFRAAGHGTPVRFRSAMIPVVHAKLDGKSGDFMLDTGNGFYGTVSAQFAREAGLPDDGRVLVQSSGNLGGALRTPLIRAKSLELGPCELARPVFAVTKTETGALAGSAFAGNIGESVLSRFDLTFDYGQQTIYCKPNAWFSRPFLGSIDGMSLFKPSAAVLQIAYVNADSPAEKAGLRAGDRIVSVDGESATSLGLDDVLTMERAAHSLRVDVDRDGVRSSHVLVLEEMLP